MEQSHKDYLFKFESIKKSIGSYQNPELDKAFKVIEFFVGRMDVNFPIEKLLEGIEKIKQDRYFVKPDYSISYDVENETNILIFIRNLLWESVTMQRFLIYGLLKSIKETGKKYDQKHDEGFSNYLSELLTTISDLTKIEEIGSNISSYTINTRNQNENRSSTISRATINTLMKNFYEENESIIKYFKSLPTGSDKILHYLESDFALIQKEIFAGMLENFSISKKFREKESVSYKVDLLWNLFVYTHPHLDFQSNKPLKKTMYVKTIRKNNLLAIIR